MKTVINRKLAAQRDSKALPAQSVSLLEDCYCLPPCYKLPLSDGAEPVPLAASSAFYVLKQAQSAAHSVFGRVLLEELHAATTGSSLEIALADVNTYWNVHNRT